jgi:hypothetical protein
MIDGTGCIRFTPLKRAVITLAIGSATFAATALPTTSASATPPTLVRSTPIGSLLATLQDPGAMGEDFFGISVASSSNTVVVGAPTNSRLGSAYIYVRGASGWPATPTTIVRDPSAATDDQFGFSVAMSGNTVVIGSRGTLTGGGALYIYVKGASGWPTTPTTTLPDPSAKAQNFGYSVAVSGGTVVASAGAMASVPGKVYIYDKGSSGWPTSPTTELRDPGAAASDQFGWSVATNGESVFVGALGAGSGGETYIYLKESSGWPKKPTTTLSDPAETTNDQFGMSVALSRSTAIVGAEGTDSMAGAAYIYPKQGAGWATTPAAAFSDPASSADDMFGTSVGISGDTAVVGAYGTNLREGVAYIYVKGSSSWPNEPTVTLSDPAPSRNDLFCSVAVSGKSLVVGAYGTMGATGAAYIFRV